MDIPIRDKIVQILEITDDIEDFTNHVPEIFALIKLPGPSHLVEAGCFSFPFSDSYLVEVPINTQLVSKFEKGDERGEASIIHNKPFSDWFSCTADFGCFP